MAAEYKLDVRGGIEGCSIIYAPRGQAGEYAPLATNPYRGCGHECAYCLDPTTLIQMADGTARQLVDVQVGDNVLGVVQRDQVRRAWNWTYEPSRVLAKLATYKPALRVTLENGMSAVCSEDHRWLTERGWKYADRLTTNNKIRTFAIPITLRPVTDSYRLGYLSGVIRGDGSLHRYDYSGRYQRTGRSAPQKKDILHQFRLAMIDTEALDRAAEYLALFGVETTALEFQDGSGGTIPAIHANSETAFKAITDLISIPHSRDPEWERGWLAGIFDAEGGTTAALRIHNTDSDILSITDQCLRALRFDTTEDGPNGESGCRAVRIRGGLSEIVRFFNICAPAIRRKFPAPGSALRGGSQVVAIEHLGKEVPMFDITTSTETFVAAGMISHNCYVPDILRMTRKEFDAGANEREKFLKALVRDAKKYQAMGITEQVMLSFTTDPYHPGDTALTRLVLGELQSHGLGICTLTKGGTRALRDIDLFRPNRDAFASTLTSLDDDFSRKWERSAALPGDRIAALRRFHEAGIFTWVSLEPTLDAARSLAIVEATHPFVDLYKVGQANYLPMTETTDWRDYTLRMIELLQRLGKKHYVKKDLQQYLPEGYHNPLRVPQHH